MSSLRSDLPNESVVSRAFEKRRRPDVLKWDVVAVEDGACLRVVFESAAAEGRHGVLLMTEGALEINGVRASSVSLWQVSPPTRVEIGIQTSSGKLHVYNIWDTGSERMSQAWTSGMLVEYLPDGRRYRCNDIGLDGAFDSLVFRLERVIEPCKV